ncbi:MAG: HK97 family phage prohead protease [Syntrophomonadaceae bacterium]|nr:HK97 family phage prohead protease [Syntrophomonadaceae bacterium]
MLIRTKKGEYRADNTGVLLDFLGVKRGAIGPQKINGDVELIAPVPFRLEADAKAEEGQPWTLSTYDLDRCGERIDPAGWDFRRYMDNPVVEWAHRYDIPAIGKIEKLNVDDKGLNGLVYFNSKEYDQFGWSIGQRVKAGVIRAGSVGFRVIVVELPDKETAQDGTALIFRKQELLEFSICNVPANPWALAKSIEAVKTDTKQDTSFSSFWGNIIHTL